MLLWAVRDKTFWVRDSVTGPTIKVKDPVRVRATGMRIRFAISDNSFWKRSRPPDSGTYHMSIRRIF